MDFFSFDNIFKNSAIWIEIPLFSTNSKIFYFFERFFIRNKRFIQEISGILIFFILHTPVEFWVHMWCLLKNSRLSVLSEILN